MKCRRVAFLRSLQVALAASVAIPVALGATGCELISSIDRSKIDSGSDAAGGSTSGAGGSVSTTGGAASGAGGDSHEAAGGTVPASGGANTGGNNELQAGVGGDFQAGAGGDAPGAGGSTSGGTSAGGKGAGGTAQATGGAGLGGTMQGLGGTLQTAGGRAAGGSGTAAGGNAAGGAAAGAGGTTAGVGGMTAGAGGMTAGAGGTTAGAGAGGTTAGSGGTTAGAGAGGTTAGSGSETAGAGAGGTTAGSGGTTGGSSGDGGGGIGGGGIGGGGPGSLSKIIYVTSTAMKANFGGISGADEQCNLAPPVAATFKALIVDGTLRRACTSAHCATNGAAEGIDWVLKPNTKYVRADGTTLIGTTNSAGIFVFPLAASIGTGSVLFWTGLNADWSTSVDTCNSWTETSEVFASQGLSDGMDGSAIAGTSRSCAAPLGDFFACVEQ